MARTNVTAVRLSPKTNFGSRISFDENNTPIKQMGAQNE